MQRQRLLDRLRGRRGVGTPIGWPQRRLAVADEGLTQTPHRARCQAKSLGNDRGLESFTPQGEDLLP